jgi:hypothetical protein
VGPRAGLDGVEKRKFSNSDPSAFQPVARRYSDCAIPAPSKHFFNGSTALVGPGRFSVS